MEQITILWVGEIQSLFMLSAFKHIAAGFIQSAWPEVIIFWLFQNLIFTHCSSFLCGH